MTIFIMTWSNSSLPGHVYSFKYIQQACRLCPMLQGNDTPIQAALHPVPWYLQFPGYVSPLVKSKVITETHRSLSEPKLIHTWVLLLEASVEN